MKISHPNTSGVYRKAKYVSQCLIHLFPPDLDCPPLHEKIRLFVKLALVERELLTLKDIAVAATGLAGARCDNSIETTGLKLLLKSGVNLAGGGEAGGLLGLNGLGLLHLLDGLALLLLATAAKGLAVVCLIPLTERGGIDLDHSGLGEGVGTDKLVIGRVISDDDDTSLASAAFRGPGEVAGVETQRTVLVVATAGADNVNTFGTDTGVGRLTTRLEGSLLPVVGSLGTRVGALVPRVA